MAELYIGLMSGTSQDGIDAVLTDLSNNPTVLATHHTPYSFQLRQRLSAPGIEQEIGLQEYMRLDAELGLLFSEATTTLLEKTAITADRITAIGSHGHTIGHYPDRKPPGSLQIADPNIIVEKCGITTVADFRRRDIAAGGEGAPLVCAFHKAVFGAPEKNHAVVNIGGIANITLLMKDNNTMGFDTGPGNTLLDGWIEQNLGQTIDKDGAWAAQGIIDDTLLSAALQDPYFSRAAPKSTGREYFNLKWLKNLLQQMPTEPHATDIQATLCELTATTIAMAISRFPCSIDKILTCGGGVHNSFLMRRLQYHLPDHQLQTTDTYGIHPDWVEATAFAWLAKQTLAGRPGNLPSVTGARRAVVLGGIYKG